MSKYSTIASPTRFSNMIKTYLAKQLHAQIAVQQKSKEINVKNSNKEDIPRIMKQHGLHTDIVSTQKKSNKCSKIEYMKDYTRQKCKMKHSTKMFSEVCTPRHKLHANTLNMGNTLKDKVQKVQTEAGPHTDMQSTQLHKKEINKKNI